MIFRLVFVIPLIFLCLWYLIVSIPDLCTITYLNFLSIIYNFEA